MKNLILILTALSTFPGAARAEFDLNSIGASGLSGQAVEISAPAPLGDAAGEADRAPVKDWTVMVFLNAKNNLESFGMQDMNEMETVGSTSRMNVVVEMGRMAGFDASDGDWRGVRRYYMTRDTRPGRITSPMVQNLGDVDMGDAAELQRFIVWAKANYPARKYLLVVWNHGSGWLRGAPVTGAAARTIKGISYDDATGHNISTPQLGQVLAATGGVDVLASDACLMQMAEVAYEVGAGARYVVGSEETEPGAGYAYYKILFPMAINPSISAANVARVIVAAYWESNAIGSGVATHSMLDASMISRLATKMDHFAYAAMRSGDKATLRAARDAAQRYYIEENKDLGHFAALVAARTSDGALREAAIGLAWQIREELVMLNMTSIVPSSNSNGIAAYIPSTGYSADFNELKLARDTRWDEFLQWLIAE